MGNLPLPDGADPQAQDAHDGEQLYRLLEQEIVPLFYQRDLDGVSRGWLQIVKESIKTIAPKFCTKRMVKHNTDFLYAPATTRTPSAWVMYRCAPRSFCPFSFSPRFPP